MYHRSDGKRCWCKQRHTLGEAIELSTGMSKEKLDSTPPPRQYSGKQQSVTRGRAKSQLTLECKCKCRTCRSSHHRQCRNNCGK